MRHCSQKVNEHFEKKNPSTPHTSMKRRWMIRNELKVGLRKHRFDDDGSAYRNRKKNAGPHRGTGSSSKESRVGNETQEEKRVEQQTP